MDEIVSDILTNSMRLSRDSYRYSPETYSFSLDLLRLGGLAAFDHIRTKIPLPSRQSLKKFADAEEPFPDLTDWETIPSRIRQWRRVHHMDRNLHLRCVLGVDALAFKPEVSVSMDGIEGLALGNAVLEDDFLEELLSSSNTFRHFVAENWDRVFQAAFVFNLQPINPGIPSLVLYAALCEEGKARQTEVEIVYALRAICSQEHITLGAFAVDGDTQYEPIHSKQDESNRFIFQSLGTIPTTQKFRIICDPLHLLKRVRYRLTKPTPMVIGFSEDSLELNLSALKELLGLNLPEVIFCDAQITKMHDSLPIVLFRFQHLLSILDASIQDPRGRETYLPWLGFCVPWVLLNEALCHPGVNTPTRLAWLKIAYFYLMTCNDTYKRTGFGKHVKEHGDSRHDGIKRTMFDRKLIRHATNTIATLVYEMEHLPIGEILSLQRLSTVPVEKLFGRARLRAKTHQTMTGILDAMSMSQAMRLFHANQVSKKRKLEYGETVAFLPEPEEDECDACDFVLTAEALLHFVGFPVSNYRELRKRHEPSDEVSVFLERYVLPFIPDPETQPQRRSLYQELLSVTSSGRHSLLSAKLHLGEVVKPEETHPVEEYVANILGKKKILRGELITLVRRVCSNSFLRFSGPRSLSTSRKFDILQWMSDNWTVTRQCLDVAGKAEIELWLLTNP
jgi:hypothetical protein